MDWLTRHIASENVEAAKAAASDDALHRWYTNEYLPQLREADSAFMQVSGDIAARFSAEASHTSDSPAVTYRSYFHVAVPGNRGMNELAAADFRDTLDTFRTHGAWCTSHSPHFVVSGPYRSVTLLGRTCQSRDQAIIERTFSWLGERDARDRRDYILVAERIPDKREDGLGFAFTTVTAEVAEAIVRLAVTGELKLPRRCGFLSAGRR